MIYKSKGDLKESLSFLKNCYNINQNNTKIIYYLSKTLYLMGKF